MSAAIISQMKGTVYVERQGTRVRVDTNTEIQEDDTLITSSDSSAEMTFTDGAVVRVGPSTTLEVAEYLDSETDPSFVLNLSSGMMRSISGAIVSRNPDAFQIATPRGTIGIRGTTTVHEVRDGQEVHAVVSIGPGHTVVISDRGGNSVVLSGSTEAAVIDAAKPLSVYTLPQSALEKFASQIENASPSDVSKALMDAVRQQQSPDAPADAAPADAIPGGQTPEASSQDAPQSTPEASAASQATPQAQAAPVAPVAPVGQAAALQAIIADPVLAAVVDSINQGVSLVIDTRTTVVQVADSMGNAVRDMVQSMVENNRSQLSVSNDLPSFVEKPHTPDRPAPDHTPDATPTPPVTLDPTPPYSGGTAPIPPDSGGTDPTPPDSGGTDPTPPDSGGTDPTPPDSGGTDPTPPDSGGTGPTPPDGGDDSGGSSGSGGTDPTPPDGGDDSGGDTPPDDGDRDDSSGSITVVPVPESDSVTHDFSNASVTYSGGAGSMLKVISGSEITLKPTANELIFASGDSTSQVTLKNVPTLAADSGHYSLNTSGAGGNVKTLSNWSEVTAKFTYADGNELSFKGMNTVLGGTGQKLTTSALSNTLDSTGTLTVGGDGNQTVEFSGFEKIYGGGFQTSLKLEGSSSFVISASADNTYTANGTTTFANFRFVEMSGGTLSLNLSSDSDAIQFDPLGSIIHNDTLFAVENSTISMDAGAGSDTLKLLSDSLTLTHNGEAYSMTDSGNTINFNNFEAVTVGPASSSPTTMQLDLSAADDTVSFSTNGLVHAGVLFTTTSTSSKFTVEGGGGDNTLELAGMGGEVTVSAGTGADGTTVWKTTVGGKSLTFSDFHAETNAKMTVNFTADDDNVSLASGAGWVCSNSGDDSTTFSAQDRLSLKGGEGNDTLNIDTNTLSLTDNGDSTFVGNNLAFTSFEHVNLTQSGATLALQGHNNADNQFSLSGDTLSYVANNDGPTTTFTADNFELTGGDPSTADKLTISSLGTGPDITVTVGNIETIDIKSVIFSTPEIRVHEYSGDKYLSLVWDDGENPKLTLNLIDADAKVTDLDPYGDYTAEAQDVYTSLTSGGGSLHIVTA